MHDLQRTEKLQSALIEVDRVVFKGYLENINTYPVVSLATTFDDAIVKIRLRKISKIVYDKNEDNLGKFNNIFSALHSSGSSVVLILKGSKRHTDIYIGTNKITNGYGDNGSASMETLHAAIKGNFPGVDLSDNLDFKEIHGLLNPIQNDDYKSIASVAGVPSLKNTAIEFFSQGIDKIIEGMKGREYISVIQASPVGRSELESIEGAYQDIHSALSLYEQKQVSLSINESRAVGITLTDGLTKTLSESVADTQTYTTGTSDSSTHSTSDSNSDTANVGGIIASSVGIAGTGIGFLVGGPAGGILGSSIGNAIGVGVGGIVGSNSTTTSTSDSNTTGSSVSNSSGTTKTNSSSDAHSNSRAESDTSTTGSGKSIQITEKNRRVSTILKSIDDQLNRIDDCKNYGMWNWSAYFIGKGQLDVKLGADLYSGILRGDSSGLERNNIALWHQYNNEREFKELQKYLSQLKHPLFETPENFSTKVVSHTSLVSTKEMTVAMSLPQKSLPGIPVFDSVAFGRSVTRFDINTDKDTINIGSIFNFGTSERNNPVEIDTQSLMSHTFITGSTGAGKSNAVYKLIDTLYTQKNIPFLIIEPAKGEYKQIFGGRKGVHVFGTNPKLHPLLRLNPFSFPENIHVMEHIDRLIEILNAVWPMYAAMPAILKESIEYVYEKSGWDLLNSECRFDRKIFPDFHDLLEVLPDIINSSDYSQEIKGNYVGALVTRVRSLTNGYFKTIFQKDELSPVQLFDDSCIIDLSRVGSSETKSLLMGIIFLKLQEYRISNATEANSRLRHITVLEEAHNLLRRTSSAQSQDSSNLQGKSVEMISNAIAEMRTYGEGFIIADQAPALLDQSVIRNTSTKIILRLPDFDDRNLVGKAAHLNEDQIDELARLKTGCAAVYQNNWLEPVLCQFDQFEDDKIAAFAYEPTAARLVDARRQAGNDFIKYLVAISLNNDDEIFSERYDINHWSPYFPHAKSISLGTKADLNKMVSDVIKLERILERVPKVTDLDVWIQYLLKEVNTFVDLELFDSKEQFELLKMLLGAIACETPHNEKAFKSKIDEIAQKNGVLL